VQSVVEIVLPVFGLVLAGWALAQTSVLSREGVRGLSNFVFYIAIPTLLFRTMARGAVPANVEWGIVLSYFGGCLLLFAATLPLGRLLFGLRTDEAAVLAMGATFSNTLLLGVPLVLAAFGEAGLLPIMLIVAFHSTTLITLTTIVVELSRGRRGGQGRIALATLKALAQNPVVVGLAAGLVWGAADLPLPKPVDRFAQLLAGAAPACALFALGATLAGHRIAGNLAESLTMVALKLVAHPLIVWLLATQVFAIDPMWAAIATITAALPVGANVFVLAQKYEIYVQRSTSATLLSTAVAVLTVALLVGLLAPAR
jgi:predicted permease